MENIMQKIKIDKITLNFGAGTDQNKLEKGMKLLKTVCGKTPVKTFAKDRIPAWGLRKNLPIGCKITLRGKEAEDLLRRLLKTKDNIISNKSFDSQGNFSIGISEYIDMTDVKYDPEIGIIGFEAAVTLKKPGYRITKRRLCRKKLPDTKRIKKEEALMFVRQNYGVKMEEEA